MLDAEQNRLNSNAMRDWNVKTSVKNSKILHAYNEVEMKNDADQLNAIQKPVFVLERCWHLNDYSIDFEKSVMKKNIYDTNKNQK